MLRAIAFAVCLVVVSGIAKSQNPTLKANSVAVENLDEYLNENPEEKSLQELDKVVEEDSESLALALALKTTFKVTYELGNRIAGKFQNY